MSRRSTQTEPRAWLIAVGLPMAACAVAWASAATPSGIAVATMSASAASALIVALLVIPARAGLSRELSALADRLEPGRPAPASPRSGDPSEALARLDRGFAAATQRAQESARELVNARSMMDAVVSPLLATDARGTVLACNNATLAFFGKRPLPIVGSGIDELFSQAEISELHAAALLGNVRQAQLRFPKPEGSGGVRIMQVIAAPFQRSGDAGTPEPGVMITLRDVTELAMAVQLKTDFVANASHELRTPLSSIRAAVETLADGAWDDGSMRQRLAGMIQGNVARLEDLVRDLLDLSRLETPDAPVQLEQVRTDAIAESLGEIFEQAASERRLRITFEIDPALAILHTDAKLLTLVLKNLIDNALKYAYPDTTVRVTGAVIPPESQGRLPGARFEVIDRGVGIPIGHQARIFQRFYQVDAARTGSPAKRGTGLGLAIVKHAVKRLGGQVSVESVWKEGTTMRIELPDCVEPVSG